jgi:hypothetical protein
MAIHVNIKWIKSHKQAKNITNLCFQKIEQSTTTKLDRWNITITENLEPVSGTDGEKENNNQPQADNSDKIPFNIINNYFSIGVVSDQI